MFEIVRGRPWSVSHTVLDGPDGPVSDLTQYLSESGGYVLCQIRGKVATRNSRGVFELPLVAEVSAVLSGETSSVLTLSLTRAEVNAIEHGEYRIDVIGIDSEGNVESLLNPEPIRVVNRPTDPVTVLALPDDTVPNFVDIFEDNLDPPV